MRIHETKVINRVQAGSEAGERGYSKDPRAKDEAADNSGSDRHFATSHLLVNLRQRTISSGVVTMGAQGAQFALNLGAIMVLARLLAPQDFGLIAMVATIMSFLRIFKDAGLSTATVQREGITHAQVSNLFWINLCVSALISLIFAGSAPAIAWFYHEPRLVGITLALSVTFVLEGSAVQHLAIFNRQMRFKLLAVIQIISLMAAISVAIAMAGYGYGYWSLVALQLTTPVVVFLLTLTASRWRPQLPSKATGTGSLVSFGANFAASGFIWSLARGSDSLLVGKFFGSDALGLYSRAAVLLHRPLDQMLGPVSTVLVPVFSRIQSEPERYRRTLLQVYEAVAVLSFFFTGLFLALARPITLVVLGPKWGEAAPIFAGFAIGAVFLPLCTASTWLFASQGRGRELLISVSISSGLAVCSMIAGLPFGPAGVAFAYSISGLFILLPIMYYLAGRHGPVTTADLWSASVKHVPLWGVVCGSTYLAYSILFNFSPLVQVAICIPVGTLAGAALVYLYKPSRTVLIYLYSAIIKRQRCTA
jgi:PST family polysaccharide transporter